MKDEHIPGESIHEYLQRYAEKHDLTKRLHILTKVNVVEKMQQGWRLELQNVSAKGHALSQGDNEVRQLPAQRYITCAKLVVSTGLTSVSRPIDIKGGQNYSGPIVNFSNFYLDVPKLCEGNIIKNTTIVGGGKAAHDVVYLMASRGK